jgi:NAD(P)-dependent dehydrogenase (short-subunit alcohol dehydrogenase family)
VGLTPDVDVPLSQYSALAWRQTSATYLDGLFYVFKAVFPYLSKGGHFVIISSAITRLTGDQLPPFHAGHYAAAKAAGDEFCKWARREMHTQESLLSRIAPASVRSRASAALGVPLEMSLSLDSVAGRISKALTDSMELDEQMLIAR